ncbi:MAG: SET domain-containing protein-lysine N-methyltransferase [Opitutaceae bacterium]|nr:SET domain-containing protein-lysine N-methyltransferase [Opitutaceae bacterium]
MSSRSSLRPVRPAPSRWVRRRRSAIHGSGLIAARFIPAGTRIIEYVGERITKAEADRREAVRLAQRASGRDGCVYVFELNRRHDIDGDVPWNPARLINHSCAANCEPEVIRGRIWIIALRDIAAGEELGYDYGFDLADWREHPCLCGTAACTGYIVKKSQRWRVRRLLAGENRAAAG